MEKRQVDGMEETGLVDFNVAMSNQLVRASHSLTLVEKRVLSAVISKIDSRRGNSVHAHLSEFQKVRLTAIDYAEAFNVCKKTAYRDLKAAADHLFERQARITHGAKNRERVTRFRWVSAITYAKTEGFIEMSFTAEVYPHLNMLKREYTEYKLKNAVAFRSVYTWRIFELAKSWLEYCEEKKKPVDITLENLKLMLDVPEKYKWDNVKKRALDPAIKQINATSNEMDIRYVMKKTGRKVSGISIMVKKLDQLDLLKE